MLYAPFGTAQGLLTTPLSQGASLGSGDSSVICLQYAANTSVTSYSHTIHYPKVDDYSSFDIDANGTLSTSGQVRAIVGNLRSPWIPIVSGDLQISMFTVIIKLDGGKLDEVSLDQCGCGDCIPYTTTGTVCRYVNGVGKLCEEGSVCSEKCDSTVGCKAKVLPPPRNWLL